MTDNALIRIGRITGAASNVATVAVFVVIAVLGRWDHVIGDFIIHNGIIAVVFGWVAWTAIPHRPRNAVVWALALAGAFAGLYVLSSAYMLVLNAIYLDNVALDVLSTLSPSELPDAARFVVPFVAWAWVPAFMLPMTLGLLLFPDGRFASSVTRSAGWLSIGAIAAVSAGLTWVYRPTSTMPIGADSNEFTGLGRVVSPALIVLMALAAYSIVDAARRYRKSEGEARRQFQWIVLGTGLLVAALLVTFAIGPVVAYDTLSVIVILVAAVVFVTTYGIAITKYRLYDVDMVVNRTIVFVGLASFITAIYAAVAVGIGALVGGSSVWLSIFATAIVAVAFEPVRARVQKWANRIVYGSRATPYEVLSDLTGKLATAEHEEGLLERMAMRLAEGTGATHAVVWLKNGSGLVAAATAPDGALHPVSDASELPGTAELIRHDGVVLGALSVEKERGERLTPAERSLMSDLAGSAALVLRKLRLDSDLEAKAAELQVSRRRLVDAEDEERRRLERALDDGAQQQVVGLRLKLRLAHQMAEREDTDRAMQLIDQMSLDAQTAIYEIRALAQGIYPPLLEADGLRAALAGIASASPMAVEIETDRVARYSPEIEGAVYFCVSEALTNAVKHGRGPVLVSLAGDAGTLRFEVSDSGPGFDPATAAQGSGLTNMADRLEALGGDIAITSALGSRTVISGEVTASATAAVS